MAEEYGVKVSLVFVPKNKNTMRNDIQKMLDGVLETQPLVIKSFRVQNEGMSKAIRDGIKEANKAKLPAVNLNNFKIAVNKKELQDELNKKELTLKISKIDASSAVTKLRNDLVKMLSGLQIGGVKEFLDGAELRTQSKAVESYADNLQRLKTMQSALKKTGGQLLNLGKVEDVREYVTLYNQLSHEIALAVEAGGNWDNVDGIQDQIINLNALVAEYKKVAAERVRAATVAAEQEAAAAQVTYVTEKQILRARTQALTWLQKNTNATKEHRDEMRDYLEALSGGNITTEKYDEIVNGINKVKINAQMAGKTGKTFFETFQSGLEKFGGWSIVTKTLTTIHKLLRNMVKAVIDVDTAMTELKRVTDLTASAYTRFTQQAIVMSKRIGASLSDTITATADFARLGYDINEAADLAEAALTYKNIGDGIDDISTATESIISTMKAFGYEAADSMYIVDMFNEVGNNFAISSTGIGEALQRSASAMAEAGNTLQESIGLITAANEIIQDPDVVGTTMKTLTMYLRAAKVEAEDAGIATDGMANSVSELRDQILQLTGNRVDIMIDDNTFKSTYQIMKELSVIWDGLTDTSRSGILELIGGKRNANTISALLKNFEQAADVMETAMDAVGSATLENEKYLDSIQGKLSVLKASFEELATSVINSELVKKVIELGTVLANVATFLSDLGALLPTLAVGTGLASLVKQLRQAYKVVQSFTPILEKYKAQNDGLSAEDKKTISDALKGFTDIQKSYVSSIMSTSGAFSELNSSCQNTMNGLLKVNAAGNGMRAWLHGVKEGIMNVGSGLKGLTLSFKTLLSSLSMLSKISIAITLVSTAFTWISKAAASHNQFLEENETRAKEAAQAYIEQANSVAEATSKYRDLKEALASGNITTESYTESAYDLLASFRLQGESVDGLIKKYGDLDTAMYAVMQRSLSLALPELIDAFDDSESALLNTKGNVDIPGWVNEIGGGAVGGSVFDVVKEWNKDYIALFENVRKEIESIAQESGMELRTLSTLGITQGYGLYIPSVESVDRIVQIRNALQQMMDVMDEYEGADELPMYSKIYDQWLALNGLIDSVVVDAKDINENLAQAFTLEAIQQSGIPETQDAFEQLRQNLIDLLLASSDFRDASMDPLEMATDAIDTILSKYSWGAGFLNKVLGISSGTIADVKKLTDAMSKIEKNADLAAQAYADMYSTGSLSQDTIASLIDLLDAGEDILQYLELENGQLVLNQRAWRERNANMTDGVIEDYTKQIESYQALITSATQEGFIQPDGYSSIEEYVEYLEQEILKLEALIEHIEETSRFPDLGINLGLENVQSELKEVTDSAAAMKEAYDKVLGGVALTQQEIFDIAAENPELGFELAGAVGIEEQQEVLERQWEAYKDKWQSIVDEQVEQLERQRDQWGESSEEYDIINTAITNLMAVGQFTLGDIIDVDDSDEDVKAIASLSDALSALDSAVQFRSSMRDGTQNAFEMIEQAQAMAEDMNQLGINGKTDHSWLTFAHPSSLKDGIENIQWSEAALRAYTDAIIDSYISSTDLASTQPELVRQWKEEAYQATQAERAYASLSDAMSSINNAIEFRNAIADGETGIVDMISKAQTMADELNRLAINGKTDHSWLTFADPLSLTGSVEDIRWSEQGLRAYSDAIIDSYIASTDLAEVNPELVQQLKELAYAATEASQASANLGNAIDAVTNVQTFRTDMGNSETSVLDLIKQAQTMADELNSLGGSYTYDWTDFTMGLSSTASLESIKWNEEALRAYVNLMVDSMAEGSDLTAEAIQNWKDMAFAEAKATVELQAFNDQINSLKNASSVIETVMNDMADDNLLSLETLASVIDLVGDEWLNMVDITENGFSMKPDVSLKDWMLGELKTYTESAEFIEKHGTEQATEIYNASVKAFEAMLAGSDETVTAYDALASAIDRVRTASSLLTDIQSGDGDVLSMFETANQMAEDLKKPVSEIFQIVDGEVKWDESTIEEWAKAAVAELSSFNDMSQETRDYLIALAAAEIEAASKAEQMATAYSKAKTAMSSMPSRSDLVELTYDAYNELIEIDHRYAAAVQYQNGVLTLNRDKYAAVTQEVLNATKAQAAANIQSILADKEYQKLIRDYDHLGSAEQEKLNRMNAEIASYQVLISELENATSAYQRFLNASTETTSSRYSAAENARQVIKDTLENVDSEVFGKIGREQYMAAVDFLVAPNIEVGTDEWDDAIAMIDRYLEDGTTGVTNFYNDLITHGFIDSSGQLDAAMSDIAGTLGISMDFLRSMIDELNQYQTEENKIKVSYDTGEAEAEVQSAEEQLIALQAQVEALNASLDLDHEITVNSSPALENVGSVSNAVTDLINKFTKLNGMKVTTTIATKQETSSGGIISVIKSKLSGFLSGGASAGGTYHAAGGKTLVGELGPETVVDPVKGVYYTVGNGGAEFVNLPKGAIVFSAEQTRRLFSFGQIASRGKQAGSAMAGGNSGGFGALFTGIGEAVKDAISSVGIFGKSKGGSAETAVGRPVMPPTSGSPSNTPAANSPVDKIGDLNSEFEELNKYLEHLIRHQEHLYEVAEDGLNFPGMEASLVEQVRIYKQIMEESQRIVKEMIAAGADDTNEELQGVEEVYWSAYSSLHDVLDQINALYVDALNDKIDSIQSGYSNFSSLINEMNEGGKVSVDTFQQLLDHGVEYLNYLELVDGQYVINTDALEKMLAAEKEQLAIEQALAYIAQIRHALEDDDPEKVKALVNLTNQISDGTWDLVYANAALLKTMGLTDDQYADVIHNIDMMRDLTAKVNVDLDEGSEAYEKQGAALDKILEYTEQLIEYETNEKIKAIEDEIDAYQELVDLRKEALSTARDEADYTSDVAERTKEIAALEARIAQLSLDDSREARAERVALEEELAGLQGDLADVQGDHAYDLQVEALDKSAEDYKASREIEIAELEARISSAEKLYQEALHRIDTGWDTLYNELLAWNIEAGSSLNSEITSNWDLALEAAQRYGSYVDAVIARTGNPMAVTPLATSELPLYHTGGVVTAAGVGRDEVIAVLEEGEEVLTKGQRVGLYRIVDFAKELSARLGTVIGDLSLPFSNLIPAVAGVEPTTGAAIMNQTSNAFHNEISVQISHNGTMSDSDARSYGQQIGNIALEKIQQAFERRGVGGIFGSNLKQ